MKKLFSIKSTANQKKISLTLKGLIPALIFAGSLFGVVIPEDLLTSFIDQIGLTISALIGLYGLGRRLYNVLAKRG